MEATLIKIDNPFGLKLPESLVKDYNLRAGTIIEMNFRDEGKYIFRKKTKIREGWDAAFSQYALEGEDKHLLPDFLDSETDSLL